MAKENIAFLVNLRKNTIPGSKMEGITKCLTLCMTILSVTTIFYPIISEETVLQAKPQSH